ncbi:helix-turn-helix transcriptional regulator [Myxococcus sp. CA033]|uniref:helix-turn-helix domain-containing protein n=1 Tax=Myxococcus sp. CA033 TaxID=2741516 RepID=UPI00157B220A|nr:helix-turn-helix transcriptional regulator [Myxococcus sp. CA033]NTX39142.1 helix-turn-helix transcriptional regulator [Myxococcus sp. CA033]
MYIHPDIRGVVPPETPSKPLSNIIGDTARLARLRANLTQVDVAQLLDISPVVYNRLERGRMLPSVQTLYRLCPALRTTPNELLGYPASLPPDVVADAKESLLRRVRQLDAHQALALIQLLPGVR